MGLRTLVLASAALFITSVAAAQFGRSATPALKAHLARPDGYDGKFHYCRAVYRPNPRGDGGNWLTDYPLADIDLSIRLAELTKVAVAFDAPERPRHLIVRLTNDELFQCPVIIMQEVGRLFFSSDDAARLRTLPPEGRLPLGRRLLGLVRLGCLGPEIRKVFPATEYPIVDLPRTIRSFTRCSISNGVPQIPAIGIWSAADSTSERGADSAKVHARAIADQQGA